MSDLWDALAVHASVEFPELITSYELDQLRDFVATVSLWWPHIESMPRTLVHNDFNPRNIAMRKLPGEELRLCAYDWELATLHLPQHDIAELFAFVLSPRVNRRTVEELLEVARKNLEAATRQAIDPQAWRDGYLFCLQDLAINRFGLYLMAHTFRHYGFMERTVKTLWHLIAMELHGKDVPPTAMLSGRFLL